MTTAGNMASLVRYFGQNTFKKKCMLRAHSQTSRVSCIETKLMCLIYVLYVSAKSIILNMVILLIKKEVA